MLLFISIFMIKIQLLLQTYTITVIDYSKSEHPIWLKEPKNLQSGSQKKNMCSTSVFTSIIRMVPNFATAFVISVFIFKLFLKMKQIFVFPCNWICLFVHGIIFFFSKLIIFIASSLKDS